MMKMMMINSFTLDVFFLFSRCSNIRSGLGGAGQLRAEIQGCCGNGGGRNRKWTLH